MRPLSVPAARRRMVLLAATAVTALAAIVQPTASARAEQEEIAVLRGLDKVTARTSTIEAPVGEVVTFGTLQITVRSCDKAPPEDPPEAAAFLQISETKRDEPTEALFSGWMFASSPALSALEHPIYDVIVVDCVASATASAQRSSADKPQ
ncbi:MAG: DUF2155 domain-containing protein [Rhodospirillales bacterium]|nr:DUF2155 domain-containing protein [Rhodospirillales bacterium]